jgi:hypothetical protein
VAQAVPRPLPSTRLDDRDNVAQGRIRGAGLIYATTAACWRTRISSLRKVNIYEGQPLRRHISSASGGAAASGKAEAANRAPFLIVRISRRGP